MKVVALMSTKGGVGKSTMSICLSRGLILKGKTVTLIDTDQQGTCLYWSVITEADPGFLVASGQTPALLRQAVAEAETEFVLIDGYGRADAEILETVRLADLVIMPVTQGGPDAWASDVLIKAVKAHQASHDGKPVFGVLFNRAKRNTKLHRDIVRFFDDTGIDRFDGYVGDRVSIPASIADGSTPYDVKQKDQYAILELNRIANQIIGAF